MSDYDVIIAGAGHNGLICAAMLVKNGYRVLVAERNEWVGGGVLTRELTLPGYRHDPFGSSHVWIHLNPDFKLLKPELEKHGLKYIWSEDAITQARRTLDRLAGKGKPAGRRRLRAGSPQRCTATRNGDDEPSPSEQFAHPQLALNVA